MAVEGFKLYSQLEQQYMALLTRSDSDPGLNRIWEPPDERRRRVLDKAQQSRQWGAWYKMDAVEQRCYRLVRSALEIFEQTFQLHAKGWIDNETWEKWQGWLDTWRNVRYFEYVLKDTEPRLVKSFWTELDRIRQGPAGPPAIQVATVTRQLAPGPRAKRRELGIVSALDRPN